MTDALMTVYENACDSVVMAAPAFAFMSAFASGEVNTTISRLRTINSEMSDLQSKQQVQTLEGHSDVVLGVACHPTADMIVTGGMDKDLRSIRVWELQAAAGAAAPAGA